MLAMAYKSIDDGCTLRCIMQRIALCMRYNEQKGKVDCLWKERGSFYEKIFTRHDKCHSEKVNREEENIYTIDVYLYDVMGE